jgi:hypothetical protein
MIKQRPYVCILLSAVAVALLSVLIGCQGLAKSTPVVQPTGNSLQTSVPCGNTGRTTAFLTSLLTGCRSFR